MTTTYTKSLSGDFGGNLSSSQFHGEIDDDATITRTLIGINMSGDDIGIIFDEALISEEQTALTELISAHIPNPLGWIDLEFITLTHAESPYDIGKKSVLCDTSGGSITLLLPKLSRSDGAVIGIKKISATNLVIIDPHDVEEINGASSISLTDNSTIVVIRNAGTCWETVDGGVIINKESNLVGIEITRDKGDIMVDNGIDIVPLTVGVDNTVLMTDSAESTGLKWSQLVNANIGTGAALDVTKIGDGTVSNTQFQYLSGVTGGIQTQLSGKSATGHTHTESDVTDLAKYWVESSGDVSRATGNVAIGSTDPGVSRVKITGFGTGSQYPWLELDGGAGADSVAIHYYLSGVTNAPCIKLRDTDDPPSIQFQQVGAGSDASPQYDVWFGMATNLSSAMQLQGGYLGIGKVPGQALDVSGNIAVSGTVDGIDIAAHASASMAHGVSDILVGTTDTQTLSNKTLVAATTYLQDAGDTSKQLQFQLSGITTGTVRTLTIPDADTTIMGTTNAQTVTNKTWGDNLLMNGNKITNLSAPTADSDAATKLYVDESGGGSGMMVKDAVVVASTGDLDSNVTIAGAITYTSTGGVSTRGQITATLVTADILTIDGTTLGSAEDGTRILLKDQSTGEQNGIWTTTVLGTSLTLDRATDFDEDSDVVNNVYIFVEGGTENADRSYVLSTIDPITIGGASGTTLVFTHYSTVTNVTAGTGLTKTGDTMNVGGTSTIIANSDTLEVNSSSIANQILLSYGTVGTASTFGPLPLDSSNSVTGILAIANGGTNVSSYTAGSRVLATNAGNSALETTSLNPADIATGTTSILDQELVRFNGTGGKSLEGVGIRCYGVSATDPTTPTPQAGDKYYNTAINHEMCYDGSRSKWLSVTVLTDGGGRNGTTRSNTYYRRYNGMTMTSTRGPHVAKGTIVRVGYATASAISHTFEVLVNGIVVSSVASGGAAAAYDDTLNDDFDSGIMVSRNADWSATTSYLQSTIYYKLRA